jgi:hypothetical protein
MQGKHATQHWQPLHFALEAWGLPLLLLLLPVLFILLLLVAVLLL